MMDYVASFNRSLMDATSWGTPAHEEWESCGDVSHHHKVTVPYQPQKGTIPGFFWLPQQLRNAWFFQPPGFYFGSYATEWEKRYSVLVPGDHGVSLSPVMDPMPLNGTSMYPVIAHHGKVRVSDILVPKEYASKHQYGADVAERLEWILTQTESPVYVERNYPEGCNWVPIFSGPSNIAPTFFTVVTDPEGQIILVLNASGSEPGLKPDPIFGTGLDYLATAIMLIELGGMGFRLVRALVRRGGTTVTSLAKARAKWGTAKVLQGGLEGSAELEVAKQTMSRLLPRMVGASNKIGLKSFKELHKLLEESGFKLIRAEPFGPPGGQMLFYQNGNIVARFKTLGNGKGFRVNVPHISFGYTDGKGLAWFDEMAKFDYNGNIRAKNITTPEKFDAGATYKDPKNGNNLGNPHRGTLIDKNPAAGNQWADDVHFDAQGPTKPWTDGVDDAIRSRLGLVIPGKGQSTRLAEKPLGR